MLLLQIVLFVFNHCHSVVLLIKIKSTVIISMACIVINAIDAKKIPMSYISTNQVAVTIISLVPYSTESS